MAKITRQSWLIGFSIPLMGILLYPSLALNYPALPFNGITDLYDQYQHGHYYSPVMTQNMHDFRDMLEKYHSQHQKYPQNVKSLYDDAQAKGYWVYLKPIAPNNLPAPFNQAEDFECCQVSAKQKGKVLYQNTQATQQRKALQSKYSPHDYSQENYYGIDQSAVFSSNQNGTLLMAKGAYLMF